MNEYQLKVEFLGKVVTRLEAEKAQHERATRAAAAADSRKNSFCGDVTDGGAQSSDVTAMPVDGAWPGDRNVATATAVSVGSECPSR